MTGRLQSARLWRSGRHRSLVAEVLLGLEAGRSLVIR
jgi:hypothetical protein